MGSRFLLLHRDLIETVDDLLADLMVIHEALRNQRQDLNLKSPGSGKQQPYRRLERRALRDAGTKRRLNPAGYNAKQRDRHKRSKSGTKADGTTNKIQAPRQVAGKVMRRMPSLRGKLR